MVSPHSGLLADWSSSRREEHNQLTAHPSTVLHPATNYWLKLSRLKPRTLAALDSSSPCSNLFPRMGSVLERLPATAGSPCQAPAASFPGMLGAGAGRRRGFAAVRVNALARIPFTYLFSSLVTERRPPAADSCSSLAFPLVRACPLRVVS